MSEYDKAEQEQIAADNMVRDASKVAFGKAVKEHLTTIKLPGDAEVNILNSNKRLIVRYGSDQTSCATFTQAMEAIGLAVMHSLASEGKLPDDFDMN